MGWRPNYTRVLSAAPQLTEQIKELVASIESKRLVECIRLQGASNVYPNGRTDYLGFVIRPNQYTNRDDLVYIFGVGRLIQIDAQYNRNYSYDTGASSVLSVTAERLAGQTKMWVGQKEHNHMWRRWLMSFGNNHPNINPNLASLDTQDTYAEGEVITRIELVNRIYSIRTAAPLFMATPENGSGNIFWKYITTRSFNAGWDRDYLRVNSTGYEWYGLTGGFNDQ